MNAESSGSITARRAQRSVEDDVRLENVPSVPGRSASMAERSSAHVDLSDAVPWARGLMRSPLQKIQQTDAEMCGAAAAIPAVTASRLSNMLGPLDCAASDNNGAHKAAGHRHLESLLMACRGRQHGGEQRIGDTRANLATETCKEGLVHGR
jgi:hypothetical protein